MWLYKIINIPNRSTILASSSSAISLNSAHRFLAEIYKYTGIL